MNATTARLEAERAAARLTHDDVSVRDARAAELKAELAEIFARAEREGRDPNDLIVEDALARFPARQPPA